MKTPPDKLHLGCGLITPPGWLNLDGSWNARMAKYPRIRKILGGLGLVPKNLVNTPWSPDIFIHDVRKPLPFASESFSAIYSSHMLEHLYSSEAEKVLRECLRVLRPGGVLRIMVPDLGEMSGEYSKNGDADRFMEALNFRDKTPPAGSWLYKMYSLGKDFHTHKWMYDSQSLVGRFKKAGFKDVRQMPELESRIGDVREIEKNHGLCVEGLK